MATEKGWGFVMRDRGGRAQNALLALLMSCGFVGMACAADPVPSAAGPGDYRIHAGDRLLVGVYDDPKMPPMDLTVTPDGKFSFPLLGSLIAGGKTAEQLRVEMETKLRKFVAEPVVTVSVTEVKGNVAYVIGQVNKPGLIVMNPALNVLQALSVAGGGNPYAKLDNVIVIRSTPGSAPGAQRVLNFRYGQVSAGRNLEQNVQLESGDVVVVP